MKQKSEIVKTVSLPVNISNNFPLKQRGVFRTIFNAYVGAVYANGKQLKTFNYFRKKASSEMFEGLQNIFFK